MDNHVKALKDLMDLASQKDVYIPLDQIKLAQRGFRISLSRIPACWANIIAK